MLVNDKLHISQWCQYLRLLSNKLYVESRQDSSFFALRMRKKQKRETDEYL